MTSEKKRRDIVDILGFDVAGKLSDDMVKNTAMGRNTVMAYPTLCCDSIIVETNLKFRTLPGNL
jgi:hypothetical protein